MAAQVVHVAGEVYTAASANLPAMGAVAAPAQVTANQGSITAVVDLTSLTLTFTAVANRRYKIVGQVLAQSTVVTDVLAVSITDGSNTVQQQGNCHLGIINVSNTIHVEIIVAPSAGSATYKLRAQRTGSGTMTVTASATTPAYISIEDVGST